MASQVAIKDTYILLQRFQFPTGNTTKDAIAVSRSDGLILVSLYTLMIQVTISQVWAAFILLSVAFFMRKEHSHNRGAATTGIFNASASPVSVIKLLISYLKPMKSEVWYPIMWVIFALVAVAGISASSLLIPKLLDIGNAAPVNPAAVYFPGTLLNNSQLDNTTQARGFALRVPYFLRSAGQVAVTPQNSIVVEAGSGTDRTNVLVNYRYNITAAEFGLQSAAGLVFNVEGSCHTEYGWLIAPKNESSGSTRDTYIRWRNGSNDSSNIISVSGADNGPPFPWLKTRPYVDHSGNYSYSVVVSARDRYSYTPSTDPWYSTSDASSISDTYNFIISPGRPALSCWETNLFTYNDKTVDVYQLNTIDLPPFASPDGKNSPFLTDILKAIIRQPTIVSLGTGLGRSALRSASSSALGTAFDARTSSIVQDLEYLIMASYIATKNVFVESTRFPIRGREDIPDIARSLTSDLTIDNSGPSRPGTGDFVITDPGITTLSVRALIAIPVAMAAAIATVLLLGLLPSPWRLSHALNATVLYSHLHEREEAHGEKVGWNREGTVAYSLKEEKARIRPVYKKGRKGKGGGFFWSGRE